MSKSRYHRPAPVNAPVFPPALMSRRCREFDEIDDDYNGDSDKGDGATLPPHEIAARSLARSPMIACSVLEGAGRGSAAKLSGELCGEDKEQWFFFAPMQEREARGGRPSRSTAVGCWKAAGSPGYVYSSDNKVIGMKKSMVFYVGKAPTGRKTKWKLNEYRAIEIISPPNSNSSSSSMPVFRLRHEFALCRVYVVSGSSRAFDRQPLELAVAETTQRGDGGSGGGGGYGGSVSSSRSVTENSAGTSRYTETTTSTSVETEDPIWDWEQLNWF